MNKYLTLLFTPAATLIMAACSNIAEEDRIIYVEPIPTGRNILIEDFTGQKCVNCPKATELIHELQEAYGDETIIPVAIHCGGFGVALPKGLMTVTGQTYGNETAASLGQPSGRINRHNAASYTQWTNLVNDALKEPTSVRMELYTDYDEYDRTLKLYTTILAPEGTSARFQLWLIEDSIKAVQYMPDNSTNKEYIHNHVFREALNGTWGEEQSFGQEEKEFRHTYTLSESYVDSHCSIVGFLYNDKEGVMQVVKTPVR